MSDKLEQIMTRRVPFKDGYRPAPAQSEKRPIDTASAVRFITNFLYDHPNIADVLPDSWKPHSNMSRQSEDMLRQFTNPNEDHYPIQNRRPTALTNAPENGKWRRMPDDIKRLELMWNHKPNEFDAPKFPEKEGETIPLKRAFFLADSEDPARTQFPERKYGVNGGLGNFTASLGRDKEGTYVSIYDVLDYASKDVNPKHNAILNKLGEPFKVYDRFYIDPAEQGGTFTVKKR